MWIRSQDRTDLVEVKNAVVIRSGSNGSSIDVNNYFVARYKTEERAMEVLDKIQNAIIKSKITNVINYTYSVPSSAHHSPELPIYEMPKE